VPKRQAMVDWSACKPEKCSPDGVCPAVKACEHKVLVQDEPGESPYLLGMCTACGTCVASCPLQAIKLA
jgi:translation initiation factor RLI1